MLSFGNPYIINKFNEVPAYLTSYGSVYYSQKAMVDALLGYSGINGKLPISIPDTEYSFGDGITRYPFELKDPENGVNGNYDFHEVDSLMQWAIQDSVAPGAVLVVGNKGKIIYEKAFGRFTYDKKSPKVTTKSLFDLASLTKVVGTTSEAMQLVTKGVLDINQKVAFYIPEFGNNGKEKITIKNLLLHNAGFPEFIPFYSKYKTPDEAIKAIYEMPLSYKIGEKSLYSDISMIVLQKVMEKITGISMDKYLKTNVFAPLKMENTLFNPTKRKDECLPTEIDKVWRKKLVQGSVHDENAAFFKGVSGHAGLFSTGHDLAILMQSYLNKGKFADKVIFNSALIESWTSNQSKNSSRGLGWDTKSGNKPSCGPKFSDKSFGHTGFTGTSIWVDKEKDLYVILLTNRVYPTRDNKKHIRFRPLIHSAIIDALEK